MARRAQARWGGSPPRTARAAPQEGGANVDASEEKTHADTVDKLLDELARSGGGAAPAPAPAPASRS